MGSFGVFVFARSERPLVELRSVQAVEPLSLPAVEGGLARLWTFPNGWQLAQIEEAGFVDTADLAESLVIETRAPALALLSVVDGDLGALHADSPAGNQWHCRLTDEVSLTHGAGIDQPTADGRYDFLGPALRWAAEARLCASRPDLAVAALHGPGTDGAGVLGFVESLGAGTASLQTQPTG